MIVQPAPVAATTPAGAANAAAEAIAAARARSTRNTGLSSPKRRATMAAGAPSAGADLLSPLASPTQQQPQHRRAGTPPGVRSGWGSPGRATSMRSPSSLMSRMSRSPSKSSAVSGGSGGAGGSGVVVPTAVPPPPPPAAQPSLSSSQPLVPTQPSAAVRPLSSTQPLKATGASAVPPGVVPPAVPVSTATASHAGAAGSGTAMSGQGLLLSAPPPAKVASRLFGGAKSVFGGPSPPVVGAGSRG